MKPDTSKGSRYTVSRGDYDKRKTHTRPKYSLEFKHDVAQLVLEKGYSQQQAADHLGVSLSAMGRWVRAERKPSGMTQQRKKPA